MTTLDLLEDLNERIHNILENNQNGIVDESQLVTLIEMTQRMTEVANEALIVLRAENRNEQRGQ